MLYEQLEFFIYKKFSLSLFGPYVRSEIRTKNIS